MSWARNTSIRRSYSAAVLVDPLELEAGRAERAGGRVAQAADGLAALARDVDQVFLERPDDAVATRIDLADVPTVALGRLDHPGGRRVDDGRDTTGLGIERVLGGGSAHGDISPGVASRITHGLTSRNRPGNVAPLHGHPGLDTSASCESFS
jgi:hypothetical protein